jgi:hypothetical protein
MRSLIVLTAFGLGVAGWTALRAEPESGEEKPGILLLGTLEDWKYPGIKMPQGAEMRDAEYSGIQSVELQAVLTTPDEFGKVASFYENKFGVTAEGKAASATEAKSDEKPNEPQSVIVQDDSKDRPLAVRVFVVNRAKSSTTLVVSRADGEKETHIAWSEFIRVE